MRSYSMIGHMVRRLQQRSNMVFAQRMTEEGFDLTSVQFAALDAIHHHPGIDQARVAEAIAFDRATIGGVIERLEKKGLVDRTVSPQDRRAKVLHLTPEGQAVYVQVVPVVEGLQPEIVDKLTDKQRKQLKKLLRLALAEG